MRPALLYDRFTTAWVPTKLNHHRLSHLRLRIIRQSLSCPRRRSIP